MSSPSGTYRQPRGFWQDFWNPAIQQTIAYRVQRCPEKQTADHGVAGKSTVNSGSLSKSLLKDGFGSSWRPVHDNQQYPLGKPTFRLRARSVRSLLAQETS